MDELTRALDQALALFNTGQADAAIQSVVRLIQKHPKNAEVNHRLGYLLYQVGKIRDGDIYFQRASELNPNDPNIFANWGTMLNQYSRADLAEPKFKAALEIDPELITALRGYAGACLAMKRYDEAYGFIERALAAHANDPDALIVAGQFWRVVGDCEKSLSYTRPVFDKATASIVHENPRGFGLHISTLNYSDRATSHEIAQMHKFLGSFLLALKMQKPYRNDRNPNRKIKLGYASSDFKWHSVSFFFEPLLLAHDRKRFHITLFSSGLEHDRVTERFKKYCDKFVEISGEPDAVFCRRVRDEKIDILIDLSGYTAGHRLFAFAMGGAPIQVTYIGYPNTTGVPGIDYRIVDKWTDPPGNDEEASEQLVRLDRCFLCFMPEDDPPEIAIRDQSEIVFGSFNAIQKITETTMDLWSEVLHAVSNSRIEIKAGGLEYHRSQDRIVGGLTSRGISQDRIHILEYQKDLKNALELYNRIDIALDTFPYHGTTTTCEAMWMGVPVVSLIGDRHAARVGLSLLTAVGLPEFACKSRDEYVAAAAALAADRARLKNLRSSLRERMKASPLMHASSLAREIEAAYEAMFEAWCDS